MGLLFERLEIGRASSVAVLVYHQERWVIVANVICGMDGYPFISCLSAVQSGGQKAVVRL